MDEKIVFKSGAKKFVLAQNKWGYFVGFAEGAET